MLRRKPTRLELKPEDKQEYEEARRNATAAGMSSEQQMAAALQCNEQPLKPTVAQRIGLNK